MAIEKMFFAKISGPINEVDDCVIRHIVPNHVQLVKPTSGLESKSKISQYDEQNPFDVLLKKIQILCKDMNIEPIELNYCIEEQLNIPMIEKEIKLLLKEFDELFEKKKMLLSEKNDKEQIKKQVELIQAMDVAVDRFFHFRFMKFRFGKIPIEAFEKAKKLQENLDFIAYEVSRESHNVFIVYFMPRMVQPEIDLLFQSLFFERIRLSDEIEGYPIEALHLIEGELNNLTQQIEKINESLQQYILKNSSQVINYYGIIHQRSKVFKARQYAVHTQKAFLITGWVPETQLDSFVESMKRSKIYTFEVEDEQAEQFLMPPTKLRNISFFKPFEMFIQLYGVPSYKEIDPTPIVAITYLLMFAIMFGDVGQGLVISLLGYLLYKKTGAALGMIIVYLGIGSTISGVFYGSLFGNEEFLREHLSFIPMIEPLESINEVLMRAIILGVILIICAMVMNMMNAIKSKNQGRFFFDRNGLVGLVLYFSILFIAVVLFTKIEVSVIPAISLIGISMGILLISHPLQMWANGKKKVIPKEKVSFFVESFFELFETVLSILSNTISFVRIGAFALTHAGFFIAFHILSDMVTASSGKAGGLAIMIIGNIVIIVLEGLIVGIQCLRLVYYELFSRFFEGKGSEFKPFIPIKLNPKED